MKSFFYLIDDDRQDRAEVATFFTLKGYQVEDFDQPQLALGRLEQDRGSGDVPFCIIFNRAGPAQESLATLQKVNSESRLPPVLVVDREKRNLRREDFIREYSLSFPLFICSPIELTEFVSHFYVLKSRLGRLNRVNSTMRSFTDQ